MTCACLIKLYSSNDRQPHVSPDKFTKWIKHHPKTENFNSLQDVDLYLREFMAVYPSVPEARKCSSP